MGPLFSASLLFADGPPERLRLPMGLVTDFFFWGGGNFFFFFFKKIYFFSGFWDIFSFFFFFFWVSRECSGVGCSNVFFGGFRGNLQVFKCISKVF